jgi:glycosidase
MKKRILFYEVNPLYFKDANDDGIGDLKGLLKQASYFAHLGIEAIIIPNILSMYSIDKLNNDSYKKIVPEIGTLDDFKKFSSKMKLMGIKIIIDINIGSIKETHEWFRQASTNRKEFEEIITPPKKDEFGDVIVDEETKLVGETKLNSNTNTYYFVNQETSEVSLN